MPWVGSHIISRHHQVSSMWMKVIDSIYRKHTNEISRHNESKTLTTTLKQPDYNMQFSINSYDKQTQRIEHLIATRDQTTRQQERLPIDCSWPL